jgi:hypothetical protein
MGPWFPQAPAVGDIVAHDDEDIGLLRLLR